MARTGWFVDSTDPRNDEPEGYWIVGLQLEGHVAMFRDGPLFRTEAEALDWMRSEVIGQGELPDA